jgi:hypothetical protein
VLSAAKDPWRGRYSCHPGDPFFTTKDGLETRGDARPGAYSVPILDRSGTRA